MCDEHTDGGEMMAITTEEKGLLVSNYKIIIFASSPLA